MPPRTVGPYELLAVLGRGGGGTVYRARHPNRRGEVALKLLGPASASDPSAAGRLAREYQALRALHHRNVVRVYDTGVDEGLAWLTMELVEGLDLRSYLSPVLDDDLGGQLPQPVAAAETRTLDTFSDEPDTEALFAPGEADACRPLAALLEEPETDPGLSGGGGDALRGARLWEVRPTPLGLAERLNGPGRLQRLRDATVQVCQGLAHVHAHGLVHRDLKPTNIMVDDARCVRLMDFGLVKLTAEAGSLNQHGRVVGTWRYMAPEQARGEAVDARADLYSLGVILFELLVGRPPFLARRAADLWREVVGGAAPPVLALNAGTDPELATVADRLLARSPRERFQSARDVIAALE